MSSYSTEHTGAVDRDRAGAHTAHRATSETKPSFKTTELAVYVVSVLGVLIASAMVDRSEDGQGFGAQSAWFYVTLLSIGYMVSRGLAKAGSDDKSSDPRS